ncbi:MAG: STAS domain-containing protein [Acidimicrobiia bacterium]|nr:STAS domain-containing protein [Acidimicrobiia bacterium]
MSATFEAAVRRERGVAIIDLRGEVNALAGPRLEAAYADAMSEAAESLLLNFSEVDYINSTGIALIVGLLAKARATNRPVLACGLSEHYEEIFTITRLSDFMSIFQDEASARSGTTAAPAG